VDVLFELFDLENITQIHHLLANKLLKGFAITIPYKQEIIPYLSNVTESVKLVNACNCVSVIDGKLIGYNTDIIGFEKSLTKDLKKNQKKALILGKGGASLAVQYVLRKLGIEFIIVSRKKNKSILSYDELNNDIIQQHQIIINTTPLGTYPNILDSPNIPYQYLTKQHYLFDMVYNPSITTFMNKGLQQNCFVKNGYEMLVIQAEENWKIWNKYF